MIKLEKKTLTISWKTCIKVAVTVFVLFLGLYYWERVSGLLTGLMSACAPILIGLAIAYVVNILMSFYERHYFKQGKENSLIKREDRFVL